MTPVPMRTLPAFLSLSLVLLGGCAMQSMPMAGWSSTPAAACEFAGVPAGAVFGARHGHDTATYPPALPPSLSGCQRVWYGDRLRPQAMQVLATYHYERGHVRRLVGRVPGGPAYDCHYDQGGLLDAGRSQNPGQCPQASEVQPLR